MRKKAFQLLLLAALFTASGSAPADDDDDPSASTSTTHAPKRKTKWYGGQILATDGSALFLGGVALAIRGGGEVVLGLTSLAAYSLGGPIVHGVHGQYEKLVLDFGMRIVLPVVGALVGDGIGKASAGPQASCGSGPSPFPCLPSEQEIEGALVGAAFGIVTASIIDFTALAWAPVGRDDADHDARADGLRLQPSVAFTREPHGGSSRPVLGIAGTF